MRDKKDYIGTMIAGFVDVETILLQLSKISNERYVSTQNLFQAAFNGYIHPETVFERKQVSFSAHQPADEVDEAHNDDLFDWILDLYSPTLIYCCINT